MSWGKVDIGNLVTLRQGFAINKKTKHFLSDVPTDLPLLRIADMKNGTENVFVNDTIPKKFIAKSDDIIYTRTGQVGLVFTNQFGVIHNNCFTVTPRDETILCRRYLYYALQDKAFFDEANSKATGAAQPDLPHDAFNTISIYLPPIDAQHRITDILSAYDDLIENNQKQIKLLEEAAQRLYKEWFVDLRFPGHEHTKIVDGVPEGWRNIQLSDVSAINANSISKDYPFDYIDYTDLSSVQSGIIKETTWYSLADAPGRAKRIANDGDVIWGMVRPNLKSFALVLNPKETDVFSTGFCVLSPKSVPFSYLYYAVTTENFIAYLMNCTNGAAYPAVKPIHFAEANLLCPDNCLLDRFNAIVEPMLRKREKLLIMIKQVQQARDRLLPKLMSGVVKV